MPKQVRLLVAAVLTIVIALTGKEMITTSTPAVAAPALSVQIFLPMIVAANASAPPESSLPAFEHIFVVVEENKSYSQIIGSASAPYINGLAKQNSIATDYHAVRHPSLPNYLTLIGGSTFGVTSDCAPASCPVNAPNLMDNIEAAGKTWKGYMEQMPTACGTVTKGTYAPKHDPFVYFNNIRNNSQRCAAHVVPYAELKVDLASTVTTPNFVFITPDLCNDMHNCSVSTGDDWLRSEMSLIFNSPAWKTQKSVVFIVWDEDDSSSANRVLALVIGRDVKPGFQSSKAYGHYSLLHTIEAAWHLPTLTSNDKNAAIMSDFWR